MPYKLTELYPPTKEQLAAEKPVSPWRNATFYASPQWSQDDIRQIEDSLRTADLSPTPMHSMFTRIQRAAGDDEADAARSIWAREEDAVTATLSSPRF